MHYRILYRRFIDYLSRLSSWPLTIMSFGIGSRRVCVFGRCCKLAKNKTSIIYNIKENWLDTICGVGTFNRSYSQKPKKDYYLFDIMRRAWYNKSNKYPLCSSNYNRSYLFILVIPKATWISIIRFELIQIVYMNF